MPGASGRVRGTNGGAHLHVETKLIQDVIGLHDAKMQVDPLWLFSEASITKGGLSERPRGASAGIVEQGMAFQTPQGALPPGSRINVVVTDSGDVVIGGRGKTDVNLDTDLHIPIGITGSNFVPNEAPSLPHSTRPNIGGHGGRQGGGISNAAYIPGATQNVSLRQVNNPWKEVPKEEWAPKLKSNVPKPRKPTPVRPKPRPKQDPFFDVPEAIDDFFEPKNLQKTANDVGGAVIEHGPTALDVGGQIVGVAGGVTSAVAMAAGHPEIAVPAGAIGAIGGGASALGKSLKGQDLDGDAVGKSLKGAGDLVGFFGDDGVDDDEDDFFA